ncbi:MAG: UDP-N-acetylmuramate--L-alanine ligase [Acidobacteriaceae bacterium]
MFARIQRIHFVGIGGIGMSGIAEVLLNLGYRISGSDLKRSSVTDRLQQLGATIFEGHRAENVAGAEVVVTSSAVPRCNPEVQAAQKAQVAVIQRAEMLAELMRLKYGIAIAGMHGKTTTTSMVAAVLSAGGLDPTVLVGGRVEAMGSNARLGKSQYLVAEADESDRSFLRLSPILSVITNLDREHLDCYRDIEDIENAFVEFCERVPFYGLNLLCIDDDRLRAIIPRITRRVGTYGTAPDAEFRMTPLARSNEITASQRFRIDHKGKMLGDFELMVPGAHNALNASAAVAVGAEFDIAPEQIAQALQSFRGVDRRFQRKGMVDGIEVVDDYGHHPTEIRATLNAARQCEYRRVHVIFQPHRYTRTRDLADDFATAFGDSDDVIVLDVYPASEEPIPGVTGEALARSIAKHHPSVEFASSFEGAVSSVLQRAAAGDVIITLGAGNVIQVGSMLLSALARRQESPSIVT